MTKTATISLRVDDELKRDAQDVLDELGIPMSLAIELFLKQVAEKERLPFKLGDEGPSDEELREAADCERDFWKTFMTWYFKVWPMFDSPDAAKRAEAKYGFTCRNAGTLAESYVADGAGGIAGMSDAQSAAYFDISSMRSLLSEAKELVYCALGMERAFVPRLAATYQGQLDKWRMAYVRGEAKK